MTKGKLDKVINGGMKAKLIVIGVCAILLIAMILVLCLTGGEEKTPTPGEGASFVSETSEAGTEIIAGETAETSAAEPAQEGNAEPGAQGTVNQQETGEAAAVSESPAAEQSQPGENPTSEPVPTGEQTPAQSTPPEEVPAVQPDPSPSAAPQEPQPDTPAGKPDMTIVVEQRDDMMVVTTGYCVVEYPFAFSEVIQVALKETETGAALEFTASIRGQSAPLYTLWLNTDKGVPYGTVTVGGYTSTVNVETYEPTGLTDENKITFTAAQETINDVLQSLESGNTFQSAE